jgi:hypothetical protein
MLRMTPSMNLSVVITRSKVGSWTKHRHRDAIFMIAALFQNFISAPTQEESKLV